MARRSVKSSIRKRAQAGDEGVAALSALDRATFSMRLRGAEIPLDTTASIKRARTGRVFHKPIEAVHRKAA